MGFIGVFGDVVFEVSGQKIRTFDDFIRTGAGRWGVHEICEKKPITEFLGPGQEEISFMVRLDARHGVSPRDELAKLRDMRDKGEASILVVGGEPVTWNLWTLENLQEQHKVHTGDGKLVQADVELRLKEYVEGAG